MSTRGSGRVSFNPDIKDRTTIYNKQHSGKRVAENTTRFAGNCGFRLPKRSDFSPMRYLKHIGGKVATALRLMSMKRSSPKVSSSERSKQFVAQIDSQRTEAIEDCIEFINSSSSLPRSNSVSATSC